MRLGLTCSLLFCFMLPKFGSGQTSHLPFVKENAVWKNNLWWWGGGNPDDIYHSSYAIFMEGDTIIGSNKYKFLYKCGYDSLNLSKDKNDRRTQLIREDSTGKVYIIPKETNSPYKFCQDEILLYDFGIQVGDTVDYIQNWPGWDCNLGAIPSTHILDYIDTVDINGVQRKRYNFLISNNGGPAYPDQGGMRTWIEGIGNLYFGFYGPFWFMFEGNEYLGCYYDSSIYWLENPSKGCSFVGLEEQNEIQTEIRISPNPMKDQAFIYIPDTGPYTLKIYNTLGVLVLEKTELTESPYVLDKGDVQKGLYIIKLSTEKGIYQSRILIE